MNVYILTYDDGSTKKVEANNKPDARFFNEKPGHKIVYVDEVKRGS